ncbi:MAG: hypothetical protein NXI28_20115 [bacterium]|nr:hypothetical protein [bacterium]
MRAVSHARPSPSRTPERRRLTSPQTLFRERYAVWKSAEKRCQKIARPQARLVSTVQTNTNVNGWGP